MVEPRNPGLQAGECHLAYSFSTPQQYFGGLVNDDLGGGVVKVSLHGALLLSLDFDSISYNNTAATMRSAYLNVLTDGVATFDRIEFDFAPNSGSSFSSYAKVANPVYSVNTPFVAAVDEPGLLAVASLAILGIVGFGVRRRESPAI